MAEVRGYWIIYDDSENSDKYRSSACEWCEKTAMKTNLYYQVAGGPYKSWKVAKRIADRLNKLAGI